MVEKLVAKVEVVDQRTEPLVYHVLAEFATPGVHAGGEHTTR